MATSERVYTWQEMAVLPSNSDGIAGMVQSARSWACTAYRRYPQAFIGIFPDHPISQSYQALWDKICPDPPPATQPLPENPTWRANCPIAYNVSTNFKDPANGNMDPGGISGTSFNLLGPIVGGTWTRDAGGGTVWAIIHSDGAGGQRYHQVVSIGTGRIDRKTVTITGVTPRSTPPAGGCETVPPPRSYSLPQYPTSGDLVGSPVPSSPVRGPGGPTAAPRIRLPSFPAVPIPVPYPLKPFIQVDIGPFNFQFDLGGVNLNFNTTVNLDLNYGGATAPRSVDGTPPVYLPPSDKEECPPVDNSSIITAVNSARDSVIANNNAQTGILQPRIPAVSWQTVLSSQESGSIAIASDVVLVEVAMSQLPTNVKAQFGGANAPNVTYAGWGQFGGAGGVGGRRIPLDFDRTRLAVPEFATHFSFTATRGRFGTVQVGRVDVAGKKVRSANQIVWEVP